MPETDLASVWPQGQTVKPTNLQELLLYLQEHPWIERVNNGTTYLKKFEGPVPGTTDQFLIASCDEGGPKIPKIYRCHDWRFSPEGFSFVGQDRISRDTEISRTYRYHDRSQPFVQLWVGSGWRPNPAYVEPSDG